MSVLLLLLSIKGNPSMEKCFMGDIATGDPLPSLIVLDMRACGGKRKSNWFSGLLDCFCRPAPINLVSDTMLLFKRILLPRPCWYWRSKDGLDTATAAEPIPPSPAPAAAPNINTGGLLLTPTEFHDLPVGAADVLNLFWPWGEFFLALLRRK